MTLARAKNLTDADIARIVSILDGWSGALTWSGLVEAIHRRLREQYTRQALHKHVRIKDAFRLRKLALAEGGSPSRQVLSSKSPELSVSLARIERLEAENQRLRAENDRLLEQFSRWAYNAHTRGLDQAFLSQPLVPVNRGQSVSKAHLKRGA